MVDRRRARSRTCQTERPVPQGLYPLVDQTGGFAIRNHRGELLQGQEAEVYATTNDLHSLIKYSYELQGLARSFPRSPILAYDVKCSPLIMTSLRIARQCGHCRPALRICGERQLSAVIDHLSGWNLRSGDVWHQGHRPGQDRDRPPTKTGRRR
jgi:hypothetical protein